MRIVSGMRPTGKLHLGHLSVLENWVRLQKEHECFYFAADWHALSTVFDDPSTIKQNTREMIADWLAAGINPERSTIFIQSKVPEHAELHLVFSMITPLSWLERVPTYKDQVQQLGAQGKDINTYGFLGYPLLQAADILVHRGEAVPVGQDQLPHLELTREVARRFNHLFGGVFPEPKAIVAETPLLPGIDGRKMSKSYGNVIMISAEADEVDRLTRMMVTDPARIRKTDPGHPDVCTVYAFHGLYSPARRPEIEEECKAGRIGCVACKKELTAALNAALDPVRERRRQLLSRPGYLDEILADGCDRAKKEARKTMSLVRDALQV
ncbi:tryptophan--tRNA ligase [Desulforudis sp. 1088]|uniref:tryptophan--tRNA ligase n=2 Tax=Candidatus Desulforudis TaxID=471826 RepID=UPI0034790665